MQPQMTMLMMRQHYCRFANIIAIDAIAIGDYPKDAIIDSRGTAVQEVGTIEDGANTSEIVDTGIGTTANTRVSRFSAKIQCSEGIRQAVRAFGKQCSARHSASRFPLPLQKASRPWDFTVLSLRLEITWH
jgi:hypothetical protein